MLLGDALGPRVVAAAPAGNDRWLAIQAWVAQQAGEPDLLIVDDAREEFPVTLPFTMVVCDPSTGLSDPQVRESIQRCSYSGDDVRHLTIGTRACRNVPANLGRSNAPGKGRSAFVSACRAWE